MFQGSMCLMDNILWQFNKRLDIFVCSLNRTTVPAVIVATKASKSVPTLIVLCRDTSSAALLYDTQCVAGCTHLCKTTTAHNNKTEKYTSLCLFRLCLWTMAILYTYKVLIDLICLSMYEKNIKMYSLIFWTTLVLG